MTIDWSNFTPGSALLGGIMIGVAVSAFVLFNGRVAGITGMIASQLQPEAEGRLEKLLFLLGMAAAPLLWSLANAMPAIAYQGSWPQLLIAGLLVGFGTRYGSGCTSGHGICGLSRLSPRALVATLCFMAGGFATVFVLRHWLGG